MPARLAEVFGAMAGPARARVARLTDRVWIDATPDRRRTRSLRHIERALAEQCVLALRYRDRQGAQSQRRVDPVLLAHPAGCWYLVAHGRTTQAIRWFRLDRVETASLTTERAQDIPVEAVGSPPPTARALSGL